MSVQALAIFLVLFAVGSFLLIEITGIPIISMFIALIVIIFLIMVNLTLFMKKSNQFYYIILIFLKFIFMIYQTVNKNLPLGGVDWAYYHRFAEELVVVTNGDLIHIIFDLKFDLFTKTTAVIYSVFGVNAEQMHLFVFITSLITFRYIYLTAFELLQNKIKSETICLLFLIWPIEFIHSITFLREMPIQMLFIISLYNFIHFIKYKSLIKLVLSLVLIGLATLMHSGMIGILISYSLIAFLAIQKTGIHINLLKKFMFVIILMAVLQSPLSEVFTAKFGNIDSIDSFVERGIQYGDVGVEATTNYITAIPQNATELILQIPYLISMYALSPLPWQISNFGTFISFIIEGLPRLLMVYFMYKYFRKYKPVTFQERQIKATFLLILLLTYFIFSMGTKSYGTAMRHRSKIFPLEIILVYSAATMQKRKSSIHNTTEKPNLNRSLNKNKRQKL